MALHAMTWRWRDGDEAVRHGMAWHDMDMELKQSRAWHEIEILDDTHGMT